MKQQENSRCLNCLEADYSPLNNTCENCGHVSTPPQPATVEEAIYTKKDMLKCYKAANTVWDKDQMDSLEAEFNEWVSNYAQQPECQHTNSFLWHHGGVLKCPDCNKMYLDESQPEPMGE